MRNRLTADVDMEWTPARFRDLVDAARKWGVGDDGYRGNMILRAPLAERWYLTALLSDRRNYTDWLSEISQTGEWKKYPDSFSAFTCLEMAFQECSHSEIDTAPYESLLCPSELECLARHARRWGFELDELQEIIIARLFPHERAELIHCADHVQDELRAFLADHADDASVADEVKALRNLLKSIDFAKRFEAGEIDYA